MLLRIGLLLSSNRRTVAAEPDVDPYSQFAARYVLPDDFTCTGMALQSDGKWWLASDGRVAEGDLTYEPLLVRRPSNFGAVETTIDLVTVYPSIESVQGLAIRTTDGSLLIVDKANNAVHNLSTAGVHIKTIELAFVPNGLAYDPVNDDVIVSEDSDNTLHFINYTTETQRTTFEASVAVPDHLWYDAPNRVVWYSYGNNGGTGHVVVQRRDNSAVIHNYVLPEALAIEGFVPISTTNKLYVASDWHFHGSGDNDIIEYDFTPPTADELSTNLFLAPNDFSSASWTKGTWTITADADGLADAFNESGVTSASRTCLQTVAKATSAIQTTVSFEIKPVLRTHYYICFDAATTASRSFANVLLSGAGTVQTSGQGATGPMGIPVVTITLLPDGYYRIELVFTSSTHASIRTILAASSNNYNSTTTPSNAGINGIAAYVRNARMSLAA